MEKVVVTKKTKGIERAYGYSLFSKDIRSNKQFGDFHELYSSMASATHERTKEERFIDDYVTSSSFDLSGTITIQTNAPIPTGVLTDHLVMYNPVGKGELSNMMIALYMKR